MRRQFSQYLFILLAFGVGMVLVSQFAAYWLGNVGGTAPAPVAAASGAGALLGKLHGTLAIVLLQVVLIVVASKMMGALFRKLGQPSVVGEMAAGVLLGPSLFGWLAPEAHATVFPAESMGALKTLAEVGVIVFMFCIGSELDARLLRKKANTALVVSHLSIFLPFLLGAGLAIGLYRDYAPAQVDFRTFSLFMGIAMSITAFPVLAAIIRERGMASSPLGSTALACAAIDDVSAWMILAAIIALARAEGLQNAGVAIGAALVYGAVMMLVIKPWIDRLKVDAEANHSRLMFRIVTLVFVSALVTELIGVHALFGAFLAGVVVSNNEGLRRFAAQRIEPFAITILLPLFFCYTGLRTQLGLVNDAAGWLACGAVILVATLGKLGGGSIAARMTGSSWRDSLSLGALMNTRGLMELVVLNIGLDLGLISPKLFSIMVVMALVTTLMTGPLLSLFLRMKQPSSPEPSLAEPCKPQG